jgi:hypothetical protein
MIVTFKSKAAGDVIMFGDVAHGLMKIMGKDPDPTGIITPEQLPGAIAALKTAIADSRRQPVRDEEDMEEAEKPPAMNQAVTLAQRAVPLLELLEWAQKKNTPVTWGV